jgi:GNAT superfamily N-acetyltransferase
VTPLQPDATWTTAVLSRADVPALQAFYEANPDYWLLCHGRPPPPDEAERGLAAAPPADMCFTALLGWLIRDRATGAILGEVNVATDLMAPGVTHLGFFMIAAERHGSGLASDVYSAYEAWAASSGARWLRLGVFERNARAHAFWRHHGYREVTRRDGMVHGLLTHTLITMIKPIVPATVDEYLALVPRDRPTN